MGSQELQTMLTLQELPKATPGTVGRAAAAAAASGGTIYWHCLNLVRRNPDPDDLSKR